MSSLTAILCLVLCLGVCSSLPIKRFRHEHGVGRRIAADPTHGLSKRSPAIFRSKILSSKSSAVEKDVEKISEGSMTELKQALERLRERVDLLEQRTRTNNLIFTNVRESKNENHATTLKKVLRIINEVMAVKVEIGDIYSVRREDQKTPTEVKPILVVFNSFTKKMRVLANRYRLVRTTNMDVSADYSEQVNQKRKALLPYAIMKGAQGHDSYIVDDKLLVDGVKVSLEDLEAERQDVEAKEKEEISNEDLREESVYWVNLQDVPGIDIVDVEDPMLELEEHEEVDD